jgi:hypothetical protein
MSALAAETGRRSAEGGQRLTQSDLGDPSTTVTSMAILLLTLGLKNPQTVKCVDRFLGWFFSKNQRFLWGGMRYALRVGVCAAGLCCGAIRLRIKDRLPV